MAISATRLGAAGKIYRNTGTYAAPVWNEIEHVRDKTLTLTGTEADASDADAPWEYTEVAMLGAEISFGLRFSTKSGQNDDFEALRTAYAGRTQIEIAFMDAEITVSATKGWRLTCQVTGFTNPMPYKDVITADVTMKICANDNAAPAEYTVP